jgi:hypothetical protein
MMREIERFTGTQIKPMKMPTRADLAAKRIGVFKETIRKTIAEGDLDMYVELVEQLVEEGPFDMADVAAAAARIANGSRSLVRAKEQESAPEPMAPSPSAPLYGRDDPRPEPGPNEKTVRLSMSVGRRDGIRPADVVGSIANEADIPGRDIGPIDIQEEMTFVGVPERYVAQVIEKVGRKKFRGRAVNMRIARADEGLQQKRPYKRDDRPSGSPAARAPYKRDDRPAGAPARAPYKRAERPTGPPRRDVGAPVRERYKREESAPRPRAAFTRNTGAPPRRDRDAGPPKRGASPFYSGFKGKKKPTR